MQQTSELNLCREFYNKGIIEKAIKEFESLAEIYLYDNGAALICTFTKCKYGLRETQMEFENYIIDLLNCKG